MTPKEVRNGKPENIGRKFLCCSEKSYQGSRPGCGAFFWLDEAPNDAALARRQAPIGGEPAATAEGNTQRGAIAAMPSYLEKQIGDNAAAIASLIARLNNFSEEVEEIKKRL